MAAKSTVPNIAASWLNDKNRQRYEGVEFRPIAGMMESKNLSVSDDGVLNLYMGMSTAAIEGACDLILAHIFNIWCNADKEMYEYTLNWMARMLQYPHERAHTALALLSVPGAGKGVITDMFDRGYGSHGHTFTDGSKLTGKFNYHLATSVFVCANEATYGGNKKETGVLKGIITDETITVEPKGVDPFEVTNCIHLIICTNNSWSVGQDIGDRRIVSYDVSNARVGDKKYFEALRSEINNGGEEAFFYFLMHRDISKFRPQIMPSYVSQMERENKLRSASTTIQWFSHIVHDGVIGSGNGQTLAEIEIDIESRSANNYWTNANTANWDNCVELRKNDVYNSYTKWCNAQKMHPDPNETVGKELVKLGVTAGRKQACGTRKNIYKFPSHDDCKKALDTLLAG